VLVAVQQLPYTEKGIVAFYLTFVVVFFGVLGFPSLLLMDVSYFELPVCRSNCVSELLSLLVVELLHELGLLLGYWLSCACYWATSWVVPATGLLAELCLLLGCWLRLCLLLGY